MAEAGERNIPPRDDLDIRAQAQQNRAAAEETELRVGHLRMAHAVLSGVVYSTEGGSSEVDWGIVADTLGAEEAAWPGIRESAIIQMIALGVATLTVEEAEKRERAILESLKARANMPEPSVPQTEPPK
jgi:hypothetical protein